MQCDFCELIYNEHDILDKHIFEVHQDELVQDEPPEPQRNEESDTEEEENPIPDFDWIIKIINIKAFKMFSIKNGLN